VRFQNSNRSTKQQKCCDTIFSSIEITRIILTKKQFFFKFQNDLAFMGVEIRPTADAWKRSFAAMRNDFVWNFSNCSKRIALRFQGLKTRRIAVDALLKRRVATSLKIGLFNQKIMLSALRIVF